VPAHSSFLAVFLGAAELRLSGGGQCGGVVDLSMEIILPGITDVVLPSSLHMQTSLLFAHDSCPGCQF
jgi:hypothetical protein